LSSKNVTFVKDFFIVDFPGLHPNYYVFVSAIMFFIYLCILIGNGIFLLLFATDKSIHKPMYFIYIKV
ncbi:odorant receptor, family C, subfamily 103, member 1, partial [Silurus asotus]